MCGTGGGGAGAALALKAGTLWPRCTTGGDLLRSERSCATAAAVALFKSARRASLTLLAPAATSSLRCSAASGGAMLDASAAVAASVMGTGRFRC